MRTDSAMMTRPAAKAPQPVVSAENIRADAVLDIRGLWCPLPPLKTLKALRAMKPGQVLEVLGTNPVGNKVAPWVAQKLGDQLLGVVQDEGGFQRIYLRRS